MEKIFMSGSNRGHVLAVCLGVVLSLVRFALAQSQVPPTQSGVTGDAPFAYVQILNGVSPDGVSLLVNGQPLYSDLKPGARISSFGIKEKELKISLTKSGGEEKKDITLKFPREGYYTLVLTGDFKSLPPIKAPDGASIPDYRVNARLLPNEKSGGQTVAVRVVNAASDRAITITRDKKTQVEVPADNVGVAQGQPAALFLKATSAAWSSDLYLAQEPPVANITIVFWPSEQGLAFRAMTETYVPPPEVR